jgi:hypothetical protein
MFVICRSSDRNCLRADVLGSILLFLNQEDAVFHLLQRQLENNWYARPLDSLDLAKKKKRRRIKQSLLQRTPSMWVFTALAYFPSAFKEQNYGISQGS